MLFSLNFYSLKLVMTLVGSSFSCWYILCKCVPSCPS